MIVTPRESRQTSQNARLLANVPSSVARLAGLRLAGLRLAGLRLAGLRLAGLRLAGLRLAGLRLAGLRLAGLRLAGLRLAGLRLAGLRLAGLRLAGWTVSRASPKRLAGFASGSGNPRSSGVSLRSTRLSRSRIANVP